MDNILIDLATEKGFQARTNLIKRYNIQVNDFIYKISNSSPTTLSNTITSWQDLTMSNDGIAWLLLVISFHTSAKIEISRLQEIPRSLDRSLQSTGIERN